MLIPCWYWIREESVRNEQMLPWSRNKRKAMVLLQMLRWDMLVLRFGTGDQTALWEGGAGSGQEGRGRRAGSSLGAAVAKRVWMYVGGRAGNKPSPTEKAA